MPMFPYREQRVEKLLRDAAVGLIREGRLTWKRDSGLERLLGSLADWSMLGRNLYVLYYWILSRKYYAVARQLRREVIQRYGGPSSGHEMRRLEVDMMYSLHRFGASYEDYFRFNFKHLNSRGRASFITGKLRFVYYAVINEDMEDFHLLYDKHRAYRHFQRFYNRRVILVEGVESEADVYALFSECSEVMVKPLRDGGGNGVERVRTDRWQGRDEAFAWLLARAPCVVEEVLINHPALRQVAPSSLNTVRMVTVRTSTGVEIFYPFIRFGRVGSVVDNITAGGIFALVDGEGGIVCTPAIDLLLRTFVVHPDTGEQIVGLQIPDWKDAVTLAKQASEALPSSRCLSWDLALTPTGWVIVEVNGRGNIRAHQSPDRVGKRERFEQLMMQ